MNNEKLEKLRLEIEEIKARAEKTNDLIGDSLESTTTDLRAANYVITLYSEMSLDLIRMTALSQQQVSLLRD